MGGRTRSLLLRLDLRTAGKRSRCGHNSTHVIAKGEPRFVVREPGIATGEKGYCTACAQVMLRAARQEIDRLLADIDAADPEER